MTSGYLIEQVIRARRFGERNAVRDKPPEIGRLIVSSAIGKYGEKAEDTIFPIRFFEFITSTSYALKDGPRLWDFGLQCWSILAMWT